jgi:hypothetical protein
MQVIDLRQGGGGWRKEKEDDTDLIISNTQVSPLESDELPGWTCMSCVMGERHDAIYVLLLLLLSLLLVSLCLASARLASLDFTFCALVDEPMRSRVA